MPNGTVCEKVDLCGSLCCSALGSVCVGGTCCDSTFNTPCGNQCCPGQRTRPDGPSITDPIRLKPPSLSRVGAARSGTGAGRVLARTRGSVSCRAGNGSGSAPPPTGTDRERSRGMPDCDVQAAAALPRGLTLRVGGRSLWKSAPQGEKPRAFSRRRNANAARQTET